MFVPLFFASARLQFSFSFVTLPIWTMAALALIPLFGNFVGAFIGAYVSRLTVPYAVASGLMGKGVAEIALLLVLWDTGVIDEVVFSFLVLVMFCYTMLMPPVISFAVNQASRREDLPAELSDIPHGIVHFALDNITVDDILERSRRHPDPSVSVRDFTDRWTMPNQHDYVVVEKGSLVGIVSLSTFRYLPKAFWTGTSLKDMLRRQTPLAWPDEHIADVLQRMTETSLSIIPVVERETEKFIGAVTREEIVELMMNEFRGEH